jgi:putative redox protein
VAEKPPTIVDLEWSGDLKFSVATRTSSFTLDGRAGPSPVEALAAALAGCMSIDVIDILTKGRQPVRALRTHVSADRAQRDPHRIVRASLHITIEGDVAASAVERAIALSREKYCSVWHSMRQDIELTTSYELRA